jgi:hypothetical protein
MLLVVVLVIITVVRHLDGGLGGRGSGSCVGGPATGASGQPAGNGNYRFPCSGGGSVTVHIGN